MIASAVNYALLRDNRAIHAVDEGPAYASAGSGIYKSILRAGVEGIFSIYEFRMQHHIPLLA